MLEKSLGKVLFVDEAYRLGEGAFATEAINELVDSLTKPRFLGKIIVILAGYDQNMNELLSINQELSSRFQRKLSFPIWTQRFAGTSSSNTSRRQASASSKQIRKFQRLISSTCFVSFPISLLGGMAATFRPSPSQSWGLHSEMQTFQ